MVELFNNCISGSLNPLCYFETLKSKTALEEAENLLDIFTWLNLLRYYELITEENCK